MTAPASLGLSLLLLAASLSPAVAAAPGPAEAGARQFVYFVGGQSIGSERFDVENRGDTLLVSGELVLNQPMERRLRATTRVAGPDEHFVSYLLRTTRGDSLGASVFGDSLHLFAIGPSFNRESNVAAGEARTTIVDNGIASHLWLLGRHLARDPDRHDALLAVVPQQVWTGPLLRDAAEPATATLEGKPLEVLRHRFTIAGILTFIDTSADGEFYALNVPIQNFEIRRPGYEAPLQGAAPSAARRQFPTEGVTVEGGGPALGGTLTLPEGKGPWPACIFLHGSGPMDRDMALGPNRVFAELADGLAARGIASLRYDKRTYVMNRGKQNPAVYEDRTFTLKEEVMDDAHAAYALLRGDSRFDPNRLFLLGHSLGAGAAATLALEFEDEGEPLAGIVLLAPPGRDLLTILVDQYDVLLAQGSVTKDEVQRAQYQAEQMRSGNVGEDNIIFNAKARYWESVLYWKPWDDYRAQHAPALVLFGARDYQITTPDQEKWREVMDADGRTGSRLEVLPRLNHLFLPGTGTPGPAEFGVPGHLEAPFLEEIGGWMLAQRAH